MTVEESTAKWEQEIKTMRTQMGEMKDEFKGRATKNLDDLVNRTDSPFTQAVISFPLLSKFRMPSLETFDGAKDPLDHLESFKTMMCLQGVPNEIMCRAFPTTLKGSVRIWFKKLMPGSVGSFAQLSHSFFNHFISGQRYGRPTTHLLNVKQKEGETLRSYLTRFNKETLLVDEADDKVVLIAFIFGLQSGDFLFSVYKDPPASMAEMMYEAQRHMNGKEALQVRDLASGKKRNHEYVVRYHEPHELKPKAQKNRGRRQKDRSGRGFNERFNCFTPLNAPVDHIFMQIRDDPALKWPGKLMTNPNRKAKDKYCRFHKDHSQNTDECYDLRRQIEELIKYLPKTSNEKGRILSENGVGEMKGDQAMARECYLVFVSIEKIHQTLIVEERRNFAEPTEELEEISLIEGDEKKTIRIRTTMPERIRDSIVQFLRENADVFAWTHEDIPDISTDVMVHKLNVNPSIRLVKQKRQVCALERNAAVMEEVDKLLTAGFIREVYYPECYPLLRIDQLVNSTAGHKLLSFMDAFSGYNQIRMEEEDQEKTAFITSRGLFCYKAMPFGLKNAGATYQRLVNKMFHNQIGRKVEVYVDNMLIKSKENEDHLADLKETFQSLRAYNMKLNPRKYAFDVSFGKFLEFMVSQRGIEANLDKIKAILEMSPPKTVKEIQSLMGKAAALNRFISRSTDKCLPFFKILKKAFQWTEECQRAFEELKVYLSSPPLFSPSQTGKELYLYLAVSSSAVSSALIRKEERVQKPIIVLVSPEKYKFECAIQLRFRATNNEAKYEALLAGLKLSRNMGIKNLIVKRDSQLIIGQVKGEYEARENRMKNYVTVVHTLLPHFKKVEFLQIPREENTDADRLARLASSREEIDGFLEVQGKPSTEEETVNSIIYNALWMSPIICYFKDGKLPIDKMEARKLRIRDSHFQLLGGHSLQDGFGIPRILISDNGKQFDNGPFRELCGQLNIRNHYSSPRHPQANGQVEVTNRTLLKQIKTRLEGAKSMWVKEFPSVLWVYRTTIRTPTKETPFKLTFGTEAVIPVEIGLTTLRTTFHKEEENEGQLRLNLDLLDETWKKVARKIALYQGKMAKYYNIKGKLGLNWEGPYKVIKYYRRGTYHLEDRHGKKLPHPWNAEHLKKYYS
uniref:Integrase catalytic domain-containing protein n=1 Tax=Fagus sylvatica TaxID=28930 RepID=A0A2N9G172_FAGSY